jgi:hypothetical protein
MKGVLIIFKHTGVSKEELCAIASMPKLREIAANIQDYSQRVAVTAPDSKSQRNKTGKKLLPHWDQSPQHYQTNWEGRTHLSPKSYRAWEFKKIGQVMKTKEAAHIIVEN